jgi:hypothetical protein
LNLHVEGFGAQRRLKKWRPGSPVNSHREYGKLSLRLIF